MIKKLAIYACLFLFIISSSVYSQHNQGVIEGVVTNATNMKPIAGVNIKVQHHDLGATTNKDGYFKIEHLKAGSYNLIISHLAYQTAEKRIQLKQGQKTYITIFLFDTVFVSDAVEIVAQKEDNFTQQAQRIHSIQANEIKMAPVQSVSQIMNYTSGVISNNTTGIFSNKVVVTMRGMPANDQGRTLVVMDGMPLNKADGGSVNWHLLNKNNLAEINIIKGPGPAKYGSGAMGGVIEIQTKKPATKLTGHLGIEYGSFNTMSTDANISGMQPIKNSKHKFLWNLTANGRLSDGYISTPEEFRTIEDTIMVPSFLEEYAFSLKTAYDFGNNHIVELQGLFYDDMRGNGVRIFDHYGAYSKHKTFSTLAKYSGMKNALKWQVNLFNNKENYFRIYEYMREGEYKLYEADAIREDMGTHTDFDFFGFKNQKMSFGFSGKNGRVNGSDTYYTSTDIIHNEGKMDMFAFYVQDEISLMDNKIFLNTGLRYDYANFYDARFAIDYPSYAIAFYENFETKDLPAKSWNAFSPRISLRYNKSEYSRLFISYARGFRAPTLDDMTRTGNRRGTFAVANPNLKPEIINAFELGGDVRLKNGFIMSISLFHSIGTDFMYYTSTGDTVNMGYRLAPIITRSNIGKVGISGFETEVKYDIKENLYCFANYTYTYALITEHDVLNTKVDSNLTGKFLTDMPAHKWSGGVRWYHKIINTSLLAKYYGKTWINEFNTEENQYFFSDKFEDYLIVNLRFEKKIGKYLSVSLQLENIFDKRYVDSSLQECPGRMIFFGVKVKL